MTLTRCSRLAPALWCRGLVCHGKKEAKGGGTSRISNVFGKCLPQILNIAWSFVDLLFSLNTVPRGHRHSCKIGAFFKDCSFLPLALPPTPASPMADVPKSSDSISAWSSTTSDSTGPSRRSKRARKQQQRVIHVEGIPESVPAFLRKTYYILNSGEFADCIHWLDDGQTIAIPKVCCDLGGAGDVMLTTRQVSGQTICHHGVTPIFQALQLCKFCSPVEHVRYSMLATSLRSLSPDTGMVFTRHLLTQPVGNFGMSTFCADVRSL